MKPSGPRPLRSRPVKRSLTVVRSYALDGTIRPQVPGARPKSVGSAGALSERGKLGLEVRDQGCWNDQEAYQSQPHTKKDEAC